MNDAAKAAASMDFPVKVIDPNTLLCTNGYTEEGRRREDANRRSALHRGGCAQGLALARTAVTDHPLRRKPTAGAGGN